MGKIIVNENECAGYGSNIFFVSNITFWFGTQEEYDTLPVHDSNILYMIIQNEGT